MCNSDQQNQLLKWNCEIPRIQASPPVKLWRRIKTCYHLVEHPQIRSLFSSEKTNEKLWGFHVLWPIAIFKIRNRAHIFFPAPDGRRGFGVNMFRKGGRKVSPCRGTNGPILLACDMCDPIWRWFIDGYLLVSKIISQKKWKPKSHVPPHPKTQDIYKMWKIISPVGESSKDDLQGTQSK